MESCLVSSTYQIRSKYWLHITKFDLPADPSRQEMVVSVDNQTCLIVIVLIVPGDGTIKLDTSRCGIYGDV